MEIVSVPSVMPGAGPEIFTRRPRVREMGRSLNVATRSRKGTPMDMTIVGCAGSFPGPDSPASCYLLTAPDDTGRLWRVLLDLGNGALGALQRHADPGDVDAVLLTHLHADHCLDVCSLYVALKYRPSGPPPRPVPVHGPTGTLARLEAAYAAGCEGAGPGAAGASGGAGAAAGLAGLFEEHVWKDRVPVRIGPFTVEPVAVEHTVEAYGLRVTGPDGSVLAYTGDTDDCPGLQPLAAEADLLLAEASFHEHRDAGVRGVHLSATRAGAVATAARARRLVLTHLPAWNDPDLAVAEARTAFAGPVQLARPGRTYRVGTGTDW